jgi:thioredoxin-like negative regulator of GroEL
MTDASRFGCLLAVLGAGSGFAATPPADPAEANVTQGASIVVTDADFDATALPASHSRLAVIDFWAPWCVPCRPVTAALGRVAAEMPDRMRLFTVNIEVERGITERFGINFVPVVLLLRDGEVVGQLRGGKSESEIRRFLLEHLPPDRGPGSPG